MFLMSPPAWVTEPPQNTTSHYYGVGVAPSEDQPQGMTQAKMRALQDLSSRLFITIDSLATENRSTQQKNSFFGKVKDEQTSESEIEISCLLTDIPGISVSKMQVDKSLTYCMVQLDRQILEDYFRRRFESLLLEASYMPFNSEGRNKKLSTLRSLLTKASNLGVYFREYEVQYNSLRYKK